LNPIVSQKAQGYRWGTRKHTVAFSRPEDMDGLRTVLGNERLTDDMKIEADEDTGVTEKTVSELRVRTTWPGDLVVIIPREHYPEAVVKISKHPA
jgi:hypothetical protein